MSIVKTAIVAASLFVAVAGANAQSREELNSSIHGNTPSAQLHRPVSRNAPDYGAAFAHLHTVQQPAPTTTNPLLDNFHGQAAR